MHGAHHVATKFSSFSIVSEPDKNHPSWNGIIARAITEDASPGVSESDEVFIRKFMGDSQSALFEDVSSFLKISIYNHHKGSPYPFASTGRDLYPWIQSSVIGLLSADPFDVCFLSSLDTKNQLVNTAPTHVASNAIEHM
jgi:hypothetical protein